MNKKTATPISVEEFDSINPDRKAIVLIKMAASLASSGKDYDHLLGQIVAMLDKSPFLKEVMLVALKRQ